MGPVWYLGEVVCVICTCTVVERGDREVGVSKHTLHSYAADRVGGIIIPVFWVSTHRVAPGGKLVFGGCAPSSDRGR